MSVLLIVLGLAACSYETELSTGVGACLIIGGILYALFHREKRTAPPTRREPVRDSDPYTGRVHGDTYYGVYDRNGNYVRAEELRPTVNGDYMAPNGEVFLQDSDGEYRPYHV